MGSVIQSHKNITPVNPTVVTPSPSVDKVIEKIPENKPIQTEQPSLMPDNRLSFSEKSQLFGLLALAVGLPVLIVSLFFNNINDKRMQQYELYKQNLQSQLTHLQTQLEYVNNPAAKQLNDYERILKERIVIYNKEKYALTNEAVYVAANKKMKELDNEIIKCNVHILNIEKVKQNNFQNIDEYLEILKKENIK